MALEVKNPPANVGDRRDVGLIPRSGRSPGGGHDSPLQCSCLQNPMDRGVWWATVHRVTESDTAERLTHKNILIVLRPFGARRLGVWPLQPYPHFRASFTRKQLR